MKFFFNSIFYLLVLFVVQDKAYSLSEKQIKEICQKKQTTFTCEKDLKSKSLNLIKGNRIEIPVIPFRK